MQTDRYALSESLKLRALLRQLPDEQLSKISRNWGFRDTHKAGNTDKVSGEHLADFLYPRMNSETYFQQIYDRLSEEERDALKFVGIHGGELPREELNQRLFKGAVRIFRKVSESLLDKGLFYEATELPGMKRSGEQWFFVPEVFLTFLQLPIHCQGFLGNLLRQLGTEELSALAKRVLKLEDHQLSSPLELRYDVRKFLTDPEKLRTAVEELPEMERAVFEDLLARKGQCLYRDLLDATGARKVDHSKAEYINQLAQTSGLVFTVSEGHNKYMNSLMIPRDLYYMITRRYQPDVRSLQRIESMAGIRREAPTLPPLDNSADILRDLAVFAARMDMFQPKKLTTGGINKADLKKMAAIFSAAKQTRYTSFLSTFFISSETFVEIQGAWRASETLPAQLHMPEQMFLSLFQWWLKTVSWNEFFIEGVAPTGDRPPQLWTNVVELRQAILSALQQLQKDRWVSYASFWDTVVPLLDTRLPKGSGGGGYGGILSVKEAVSVVIRESLFIMGVTTIANTASEDDTVARSRPSTKTKGKELPAEPVTDFQFKLSPMGRKLVASDAITLTFNIESEDNPVSGCFPQGAEWVIVQPNLEIVAPRDLALDNIFQLARLCTVKNIDVMTTLELSRESLRPVLDRGAEKESIVSFLTGLSRMDMPASVNQLIEECSTKHGEIRLGSSSGYIIAEDNTVLESIWRHPKLAPFIKERYGDNVLLLASETDLNKVAKELRSHGHSPLLETGAVHSSQDNRFHLALTELEMQDVIAAVRFLSYVEKILEADLTDGRAATMAHRLQPDSTGFLVSGTGVETRSRQLFRRFEAAFNKHDEDIVEKYKTQVSKLVSRSATSRGPSKYQYKGANPAVDKNEIEQLIIFAQDYELEVELLYLKQNEQETRVVVLPRGVEGERIYAHNGVTDTDAVYALSRILRARLL